MTQFLVNSNSMTHTHPQGLHTQRNTLTLAPPQSSARPVHLLIFFPAKFHTRAPVPQSCLQAYLV